MRKSSENGFICIYRVQYIDDRLRYRGYDVYNSCLLFTGESIDYIRDFAVTKAGDREEA